MSSEMALGDSAEKLKHLQRCMSDLVSVLGLRAVWSGQEPRQVATTFHDALITILNLDFLYTRARTEVDGEPIEILRTAPLYAATPGDDKIFETLNKWFGDDPKRWPTEMHSYLGGREISLISMRLGIEGEIGIVIAGSERADFPTQTERLMLGVAANQAAVGLQQARLLNQQKRIADELDRRVAERTRELDEANKELQLQVGLLQHLPVSTWTLKPDGTPDFVNQFWLEYSGQTLDFVRSHPEAWMTAVHPEDRETASSAFWDGVRSGQGFAFETRSRRARDGVYRWHLQQAVVLRDPEGKVLKFVGTTTDIHDQKLADEALRASETNLRRVIDTIPTLSWCNLPDGPNEFLSKGWHDYTGLSPEEAHGWGWQVTFHPEDLPALMVMWQAMLISGESGEIEARIRRYDGVYRWFLIRAQPFRDDAGNILRWYGTSTDIDDRKRAEDELKRTEERYRVVVETANDAVISMDETGVIILANPATKRIFGYDASELIGKSLTLLMPEAVRGLHELGYRRYLATGQKRLNWQGVELTALRANGEEFPVEVSFGEMTSGEQRVFTGFIRDITEKKRAEEVIRASERRLDLTINTMPALAWSARPDGSIEFLSERWLNYTGMSAAEAEEWGWAKAIHPEDLDPLMAYWQSVLASGEPGEIEARVRQSDGQYRWFLIRVNPLRDEAGAVVQWYGTNVDIEDRKRSEQALRESEERFRLIVDGIAGLVAIMSPEGELEVVNRRVLAYFGKTVEDLKGWSTGNAVHPDDLPAVISAWKRSLETASVYDVDHRLLGADGQYRWFHARGLPLCDSEGRVLRWYVLLTDIQDRRQAEEALTVARAELAHIARATSLGALTASIAHEVNQPLSGIVMNASTCVRMLDSDPPNIEGARETARRTIRDGNRASELVTRLRALYKRKEVAAEWIDLNDAALEVIALSLSELQNNRILVQHELAENLPTVRADRIQLQQVILNLLRNASDSMRGVNNRPRQLLIKTEIAGNQNVRLTVQDTGIGFAPDAADRLFESFYTTKDDGMGIGLFVSRSIIEAHGGRLWASPNDGPGSSFAFSIPLNYNAERV